MSKTVVKGLIHRHRQGGNSVACGPKLIRATGEVSAARSRSWHKKGLCTQALEHKLRLHSLTLELCSLEHRLMEYMSEPRSLPLEHRPKGCKSILECRWVACKLERHSLTSEYRLMGCKLEPCKACRLGLCNLVLECTLLRSMLECTCEPHNSIQECKRVLVRMLESLTPKHMLGSQVLGYSLVISHKLESHTLLTLSTLVPEPQTPKHILGSQVLGYSLVMVHKPESYALPKLSILILELQPHR
ncbi:hypothetical protein Cgig2_001049 [Carnegiea gigantea]|uniref:Uncharacterized protein n=1 Tax=Carnegiea gigantea TaxID=171969 RepID=A0A9Q1JMV4_9CARY|nr:hypothetical protein Cgig2_001049 [Carnegiea gigantea]